MSKYFTVSLPVKPYIKKYVETLERGPVQFSGKSMLCTIIRAYMQNKNSTGLSKQKMASALALRTANIEIKVHYKCLYTIGNTLELTPDAVLHINAFLQDCFERAFLRFMDRYSSKEGRYKGYKQGIEAFAETFGIILEDDISFDGLKQMHFRTRKKEEIFFSENVPSISRAA